MTHDPGFDLSGRRVLVTGASTGIGAATARRLAGAGARVVAVSRSGRLPSEDDAGSSSAGTTGGDEAIVALAADLSDPDSLDGVIAQSVDELGGLDVVVNNAGRGEWSHVVDLDRAFFDGLIDLNLWAPLRLSQLAYPHLADSDAGVVVMVGSVDASRPSAGGVVYGATKAALAAATVALAKEWGADGIRVVQVDPGLIETPMAAAAVAAVEADGFDINIARRAGRPGEIAGLIHYLVSPLGAFATGTSYRVDGGALALGPFDMRPTPDG